MKRLALIVYVVAAAGCREEVHYSSGFLVTLRSIVAVDCFVLTGTNPDNGKTLVTEKPAEWRSDFRAKSLRVLVYPTGALQGKKVIFRAEGRRGTCAGDVVASAETAALTFPRTIAPVEIVLGPTKTDADGDGWLVSEDCDDTLSDSYPGANETCDGLDHDCDGLTDCADPDCASRPCGVTGTCCGGTCKVEIACRNGADDDCDSEVDCDDPNCDDQVCDFLGRQCDTSLWCECPGGEGQTDVCNGVDDDCNGSTDPGWPTKGNACTPGLGVCQRSGVLVCATTASLGCSVTSNDAASAPETCDNGLDDDCNGPKDCADPQCAAGNTRRDICDSKDNDCDSITDEGRSCGGFSTDVAGTSNLPNWGIVVSKEGDGLTECDPTGSTDLTFITTDADDPFSDAGSVSIRGDYTGAAYYTMFFPKQLNGGYDLSIRNYLHFYLRDKVGDTYTDWQYLGPTVVLCSPGGWRRLTPERQRLTRTEQAWIELRVPLGGGAEGNGSTEQWTAVSSSGFDITDVNFVEWHADPLMSGGTGTCWMKLDAVKFE